MKTLKLLSLALMVVCLMSCAKDENVTSTAPVLTNENELFASIEKTWCYGTCPVYKFKIYRNGFAEYEGVSYIEKIGIFNTQISSELLSELKEFANEIKYFNMNDEYLNPHVADQPKTITSVMFDGKSKTIINGNINAPQELIIFEKYIEGILLNSEIFQNHFADHNLHI